MVGYSKRTLIEKLGLKPGKKVYIEGSPKSYDADIQDIKGEVSLTEQLHYPIDFIHFFTKDNERLEKKFPFFKKALDPDGTLWISWPKKSSKVETDLDENIVREIGLRGGLVDVKVAAIDEVWSGLKFVFRLKDRP